MVPASAASVVGPFNESLSTDCDTVRSVAQLSEALTALCNLGLHQERLYRVVWWQSGFICVNLHILDRSTKVLRHMQLNPQVL